MNFWNIVVIGANRGIESDELNRLKQSHQNLHIFNLDVINYDGYKEFVDRITKIVGNDGVDLLVNNAGVAIRSNLETVTPKDMLTNFEINAVAPLMLTKAFLPLLKTASGARKTVVANITSRMGSVADNGSGSHYAYRASKASMNMIVKSNAVDLKNDQIICLAIHPGWVKTDMGGQNALIDTETSVTGMIDVLEKCNADSSGSFVDYNNKIIPY
ncbi:neurexin-4-like [Sarcoptes scabiei]|nr:neurexin-4-like [Sarcoptes scabiei]